MPTINRTTSGMVFPTVPSNSVYTSTVQGWIDSLRSSFTAGNTIQAAHINSLLDIWRNFNDHYHTVPDMIGIFDYGNAASPGYSSSGTFSPTGGDKWTGTLGGVEPANVSVGDVITAAKHEELRAAISLANDHVHTIDDVQA